MELLFSDEHCPCFSELPESKTLPGAWFQFRFDGFPSPLRHWLFLGEIVDDSRSQSKSLDHLTLVVDRRVLAGFKGKGGVKGGDIALKAAGIPVGFYYEKDAPCTFKWPELRVGSTLCIMYAERELIRSGSETKPGIRVDALDYARVLPFSLTTILTCCGYESVCGAPGCGKKEMSGTKLQRCTVCKVERFCNADCQRKGWEKHKGECEGLRDARNEILSMLNHVPDWRVWEHYSPFPVRGKLPVATDFFGKGDY